MQDTLEVLVCGRIAHRMPELNTIVELFVLQNTKIESKDKELKKNTSTDSKQQE